MQNISNGIWADFKANALEVMNDENPNAPPDEGELNNNNIIRDSSLPQLNQVPKTHKARTKAGNILRRKPKIK